MGSKPLYVRIARTLGALRRCKAHKNAEWVATHSAALSAYADELPSGSGFDAGCSIDADSPRGTIEIAVSYHHMDDAGGYAGWSSGVVKVTPHLQFGFELAYAPTQTNEFADDSHESYVLETLSYALEEVAGV